MTWKQWRPRWSTRNGTGGIYTPDRDEILAVASRAALRNSHPDARRWLVEKVREPSTDWESRALLTVPGPVWTVSSDTCMTGRQSAPSCVAFDDFGREFVFRQPANEEELAAIMSADSEEVFACYRFDGLDHWTVPALNAWSEDASVIDGWIEHVLARETDAEIREGLVAYRDHLASSEFHTYMGGLYELLGAKNGPATSVPRRNS